MCQYAHRLMKFLYLWSIQKNSLQINLKYNKIHAIKNPRISLGIKTNNHKNSKNEQYVDIRNISSCGFISYKKPRYKRTKIN